MIALHPFPFVARCRQHSVVGSTLMMIRAANVTPDHFPHALRGLLCLISPPYFCRHEQAAPLSPFGFSIIATCLLTSRPPHAVPEGMPGRRLFKLNVIDPHTTCRNSDRRRRVHRLRWAARPASYRKTRTSACRKLDLWTRIRRSSRTSILTERAAQDDWHHLNSPIATRRSTPMQATGISHALYGNPPSGAFCISGAYAPERTIPMNKTQLRTARALSATMAGNRDAPRGSYDLTPLGADGCGASLEQNDLVEVADAAEAQPGDYTFTSAGTAGQIPAHRNETELRSSYREDRASRLAVARTTRQHTLRGPPPAGRASARQRWKRTKEKG